MSEHIVKSHGAALDRLRALLAEMGGLVEIQLGLAAQAILSRDNEAAARAVEGDPKIDALEREVEDSVVRLLALRQPMAADLRMVIASLKTASDLERIGDFAANAGKRAIAMAQFQARWPLGGLGHMTRLAQQQLRAVVDAFDAGDAQRAAEVWRGDEAIDGIYNTVFRELITYMMEDPRNITPCAHLLFIAKNLERVGDHVTNIAEHLYYAVTGETLPDARPKSDVSAYAVVRPADA